MKPSKNALKMRKYRKEHPEIVEQERIKSLEYYYENLEDRRLYARKYSKEHKSEIKKQHRDYFLKNYGRPIYYDIKRRCNKKNISLKISIKEFLYWYYNQERKCQYCGISEENWKICKDSLNKFYKKLQVDRKNNNLGYSLDNIVLACPRCNFVKSDFFSYNNMFKIGEIINETR
jgi:hypothetical protein